MDVQLNLLATAVAIMAIAIPIAFPRAPRWVGFLGIALAAALMCYSTYGMVTYKEPMAERDQFGLYQNGEKVMQMRPDTLQTGPVSSDIKPDFTKTFEIGRMKVECIPGESLGSVFFGSAAKYSWQNISCKVLEKIE